ncbi:uncharacterized protein LOC121609947 isoform X2 [Chelmon rostratus]|uniref:uncharacterized protein LOC121609947 isoform X2 n=1 Tax=Chelmon rostratus TaxID=109905 RepID=UPI001BE8A1FB|nr:uncharacterized protein LOC121609947 isoform X2 [Chelmon rostratus]
MSSCDTMSTLQRMKALGNRSLVIDNLTEDDQGLYWCENCFEDNCLENPTTVLSVKKEILKETNMTFYVTAGNNFTHVCPGEFTNLKWTFEASNMTALRDSVQGPQRQFVTSNKSIHIVNIKKADAGKYTCWTSGCNGHRWKILTINLCVVTVNHSEDSSVSCAVMCDMEFNNIKPASTSNVTDTRTVLRDPYGFLNCSTRQMFDGCSTVKSTHLCKTTGTPTGQEHLIRIRGISAALACLLLMAFCLICFLSPRWLKAFPTHLCCCGLKGRVEEEASVVYLSVVIRRPAETTDNHMTCNDCVYSEVVHK